MADLKGFDEDDRLEHSQVDVKISRRSALVLAVGTTAFMAMRPASAQSLRVPAVDDSTPISMAPVSFEVNSVRRDLELDTRTTLLDALREHLQLTGTKKGCDHGQCGACTVLVNGERINSCLTLAIMHQGSEVTTIEGLGTPDHLHPMQAAFIEHDGYQCGYCTPGQICSAVAMIGEIDAGVPSHVTADITQQPHLSNAELRERMSGNICRCAAYSNIADAIMDVKGVQS